MLLRVTDTPRYPTSRTEANNTRLFRNSRHWGYLWHVPRFDANGAVVTYPSEMEGAPVLELEVPELSEQVLLGPSGGDSLVVCDESDPKSSCRAVLTGRRLVLVSMPKAIHAKGLRKALNKVGSAVWTVGSIAELNLVDLVYRENPELATSGGDLFGATIPLLQIDGVMVLQEGISFSFAYRWGKTREFPLQSWVLRFPQGVTDTAVQFADEVWARVNRLKRQEIRPQLHARNQELFDYFERTGGSQPRMRTSPFTPFHMTNYGSPRFLADLPFAVDGTIASVPDAASCELAGVSPATMTALCARYGRYFYAALEAVRTTQIPRMPADPAAFFSEVCSRMRGPTAPAVVVRQVFSEMG